MLRHWQRLLPLSLAHGGRHMRAHRLLAAQQTPTHFQLLRARRLLRANSVPWPRAFPSRAHASRLSTWMRRHERPRRIAPALRFAVLACFARHSHTPPAPGSHTVSPRLCRGFDPAAKVDRDQPANSATTNMLSNRDSNEPCASPMPARPSSRQAGPSVRPRFMLFKPEIAVGRCCLHGVAWSPRSGSPTLLLTSMTRLAQR